MREMSMNGPQERYDRSYDATAKVVAFLGPYLVWGMVGAIVAGIVLVIG